MNSTARTRLPEGLAVLGVLALLFLAFYFRALPLTLDPVRHQNAEDQFNAPRTIERLARILGDETPHPVDSDALDAVRARLLTEITGLGYQAEVKDQVACLTAISGASTRCARVQNILFEAGPATGPALVLTAHYDSVDASPGAGDDGVGVAVWLEVAHHLRATPPARRVVFLLTDGEETALLGAQAFVDADAYGIEVDRIINLEARGVRGPAVMFETSQPNSGVVTAWAKNGARLFSNSLMTAAYELLPNSTDLTVYLRAGYKGVNIAIGDGLSFYHTRRDDLAMLDMRSVQHMGDQALGATRAFLDSGPAREGRIIYTDILSRVFIAFPQTLGLMTIGLCFALSAFMVMRPTRQADWKRLDWRAFLLPPALLFGAGVAAWLIQQGIGLVRQTPGWWTANTQPLNSAIFLATLLVGVVGLGFLARDSHRPALFASGWFWVLALATALGIAVPGSAGVFLPPAVAFAACAVIGWLFPRFQVAAYILAAVVLFAVLLPLIQLFDIMMGMGVAALFGALAFLLVSPSLALIGPLNHRWRTPVAALGAGLAIAIAAAIVSPAYTRDTPLALNVVAVYDMDERTAHAAAAAPIAALPQAIRDRLQDPPASLVPGLRTPVANTTLTFAERPAARLEVDGDTREGDVRTLTLRIIAPGARFVRIRIPESYGPTALAYLPAGRPVPLTRASNGYFVFDCFGRSCDGSTLSVSLPAAARGDPEQVLVQGYWTGLPADAASIAAARPDWTLPIGTGDVTVTTTRTKF